MVRGFRKDRMRSVKVHNLLGFALNITPAKGRADSIKGKGISEKHQRGSLDTKATVRISSVVGFTCADSESKITKLPFLNSNFIGKCGNARGEISICEHFKLRLPLPSDPSNAARPLCGSWTPAWQHCTLLLLDGLPPD
ncbi:integral membrane protein [Pseudozyma hubeiensis SY62]|uniref:Integral membrane protein n=1 Tax=Pseudozyma hubeiensis (strain SY62) TaxID=1305764 RepID=R9PBP9_PSEHS|nr:integral membrane protein [Pseudozyma hubeiensis SY62]GAC95505.1 integral membrane protein [Pseudozyma hubeiensis SY62]